MAIPISKFGQYVKMDVHTEAGELIFSTDSLRIDFDIRHIQGWSRAKFTVLNLAPETIAKIGSGGNYVSVYASLHDQEPVLIADRMYISNALEEKLVPQSHFNMYCYSKLRRAYLERQVDIQVEAPALRKVITETIRATGFSGAIEFKHFPSQVLEYKPPRKSTKKQGSLIEILELMGQENRFNVYTVGNKFVLMYKPTAKNVEDTDFYSSNGDIVLATSNMRSNPKLGPATLKVYSNLDSTIIPTSILDISNLLTIGTDTSQDALEVAENILQNSVAGFVKYQAISVQHVGSNWTKEWRTIVAATSPTPGTTMNTERWWA